MLVKGSGTKMYQLYRISLIVLVFLIIPELGSCTLPINKTQQFTSKQQLLEYLFEGYDEKQPFLYYDRFPWKGSRLLTLIDELGYEQYHFGLWHTSDGSSLCFSATPVLPDENHQKMRLIISAESPPRIVTVPKDAMLDMYGNIVASRVKTNDGTRAIKFPNGYLLPSSKMILIDEDYRYFCAGIQNTDSFVSNTFEDETFIYSFKKPEKPLVNAPPMERPSWMFSTDSELYLMHQDVKDKDKPHGLKVYVYKGNPLDEALILERSFDIPCPQLLFAGGLSASALDGVNKQMVVSVVKSWPYPCERFLYNFTTVRLTKLKPRPDDRFVIFFNPEILTNTVKYASDLDD